MKTISFFSTIAFLGCFATSVVSQSGEQLVLVTSVSMKNADRVLLQHQGETTLSYWDQDIARVEITVTAPGFKRAQLKALLPLGIFTLQTDVDKHIANLCLPNLDKILTIGGRQFLPELDFHVTLPRNMQFESAAPAPEAVAQVH